jgi:aspartate racemase
MHLGLVGGIGPAATAFYYRRLVVAHAGVDPPLELTLVHADIGELTRNMSANASRRQAEAFLRLTRRLQSAGSDAVAITSIAGHFCLNDFEPLSPLPIISALEPLAQELARRKLGRIGLLGTKIVMGSRLYGRLPGMEVVVPEGKDFDAAHEAYEGMAIAGEATERQREILFAAGSDLCRAQGAEAVVLGGTDLFLAFDGYDCGFPVIDCAEVHIAELHRASLRQP